MLKIIFKFENFNSGEVLIRVEMPYRGDKSINGFYSSFWKRMCIGLASAAGIPREHVAGSFKIQLTAYENVISVGDQTLFISPNGATLGMSFRELFRSDIKSLLLRQMEILELRA